MGLFCRLFILDVMTKKNLEESVDVFRVEKVVVREELVKKRKQYICNHSGVNQPSLKIKNKKKNSINPYSMRTNCQALDQSGNCRGSDWQQSRVDGQSTGFAPRQT